MIILQDDMSINWILSRLQLNELGCEQSPLGQSLYSK